MAVPLILPGFPRELGDKGFAVRLSASQEFIATAEVDRINALAEKIHHTSRRASVCLCIFTQGYRSLGRRSLTKESIGHIDTVLVGDVYDV